MDAGSSAPMDTSPGKSIFLLFFWFHISTSIVLDVENNSSKSIRPCTVRIPYSSIPGMDLSSRAYLKAISTLRKQVHGSDEHHLASCTKSSNDDMHLGMFSLFRHFLALFYFDWILSDKTITRISEDDSNTVIRARSVVSNPVIVDIVDEDPQSEISYRNSLRRQIVDGCSQLRVSLNSIDHLMELFNKSFSINSAASSSKID